MRPYPFESVRDNFKVPSLEFKVESGFGIEFENGTAVYARTIFRLQSVDGEVSNFLDQKVSCQNVPFCR
jgi:hypothetical protein